MKMKHKRVLASLLSVLILQMNISSTVLAVESTANTDSKSFIDKMLDVGGEYSANSLIKKSNNSTVTNKKVDSTKLSDEAKSLMEANDKAKLEESLKLLSADEKDAYTIAKNKYMTNDELNAFKWNLIISQFAVPYKNSLQDTLNETSFKDISDKGLVIESNPYVKAYAAAIGKSENDVLSDSRIQTALDAFNVSVSEKYDLAKIIDTLKEDNEISYAPVYVEGGTQAKISDLFSVNSLYVHDKITYFGSDVEDSDSTWKTMNNFNNVYKDLTVTDAMEKIQSLCKVKDIEVPVWLQTDGVSAYNLIFVADAIRVGGYGNYDNFISDLGNNQLVVDRWGNICSNVNVDGTMKYVIVYPAYANPLYTSQSLDDSDYAGVGYGMTYSNSGNTKTANVFGVSNSEGAVGRILYPINITLTVNDAISRINGGSTAVADVTLSDTSTVPSDTYLGASDKVHSVYKSEVTDTNGTPVSLNKYARSNKSADGLVGTFPYILRVDTTNNMLFNKPFLSNYTKDTSGQWAEASSSFYSCLTDRISSYTSLTSIDGYKSGSASTFANTLVLDKYNVHGVGGYVEDITKEVLSSYENSKDEIYYKSINKLKYKTKSNDNNGFEYPLFYSFTKPNSYVGSSTGDMYAKYDGFDVDGAGNVTKVDGNTCNLDSVYVRYNWNGLSNGKDYVMLPSMVNNSYRKGIYAPNSLSHIEGVNIDIFSKTLFSINGRGFSQTFSEENCLASEDTDIYSYFPTESLWNLMYLDSDNYKTYLTFNYSEEVLPANSNAKYTLSTKKEDCGIKYSNSKFKKYCSIPLMDNTIDLADDWGIWNDNTYASDKVLNDTSNKSYKFSDSEGFWDPTPINVNGVTGTKKNNQAKTFKTLRYFLKDQRVSDVLEKYPLSDITLIAFTWLNYYIPKSSVCSCVDKVVSANDIQTGNTLDSDTAHAVLNKEKEEKQSTKNTLTNKLISDDAVLTSYNMLKENNNLRLVYTCENDIYNGDYVYSQQSIASAGEFTTMKYSAQASIVQINIPTLLLAVNKNTSGDNLTFLKNQEDIIEVNTDELLDKVSVFLDHPATSIYNIFTGIIQKIHSAVSMGTMGRIYDVSWITGVIANSKYTYYYLALLGMMIAVALTVQGIKYIVRKSTKTKGFITQFYKSVLYGLIPVIMIYSLNVSLTLISKYLTQGTAEKMALVDIEQEVKSSESLNLNFETQYQAFREQFNDIDDDYEKLALKFITGYDNSGNPIIKNKTVKELYDEVSYSSLLANQNISATLAEGKYTDRQELFENYDEFASGISPFYYSKEEFIPVNYKKYGESVFYYFYDWIKYQYLRYWSVQDEDYTETFSKLANDYYLPTLENGQYELWSEYITRMYDAEKNLALKAYGGVPYMYNDMKYTYNDFIVDGKKVNNGSNLVDLFGLSNLFNMTEEYKEPIDGIQFFGKLGAQYWSLLGSSDSYTNGGGYPTLSNWGEKTRDLFSSDYNDYYSLCKQKHMPNSSIEDNFNPLAFIINGPSWDAYCNSSKLKDGDGDLYKNYKFSPDYLILNDVGNLYNRAPYNETKLKSYKDVCNDINRLGFVKQDEEALKLNGGFIRDDSESSKSLAWNIRNWDSIFGAGHTEIDDDLEFYRVNKSTGNTRAPLRVYASKNALYRHAYNINTNTFSNTDTSPLEDMLIGLNARMYDDALELSSFMSGDIRDSTLIFSLALACTFEFNEEFSTTKAVEPSSLALDTMTMDNLMRVSFATDINQIVKQHNVIYMLCDMKGGILVALPVVIGEVFLCIALILRFALIAMLLLSAFIVCFTHMFTNAECKKTMFIGLISQCLTVIMSQIVVIGSSVVLFTSLGLDNGWLTNIVKALLIMLCYYFVMRLNLSMLTALIKNCKQFGGDVIAKSVSALNNKIGNLTSSVGYSTSSNININVNNKMFSKEEDARRHNSQMINNLKYISSDRSVDRRVGSQSMGNVEQSDKSLSSRHKSINNMKTLSDKRSKYYFKNGKYDHISKMNVNKLSDIKADMYLTRTAVNAMYSDKSRNTKVKMSMDLMKYMRGETVKMSRAREIKFIKMTNAIKVSQGTTNKRAEHVVNYINKNK